MVAKKAGATQARARASKVKGIRQGGRLSFGDVVVSTVEVKPSVVRKNVVLGQKVAKAFVRVVAKPGVELQIQDDVPYFHADPADPTRVVRVLNGEATTGTFRNGKFKPVSLKA